MREFLWDCPRCGKRNRTNLEAEGSVELVCHGCLKSVGDPEAPSTEAPHEVSPEKRLRRDR